MVINYNKLLIDKNMTKTDLKNITGMNLVTLENIDKDKFVSSRMIDEISDELDCDVNNIMEHILQVKILKESVS